MCSPGELHSIGKVVTLELFEMRRGWRLKDGWNYHMVEVTLCVPRLLGYDTKSIMSRLQYEVWGGETQRVVWKGGGGRL